MLYLFNTTIMPNEGVFINEKIDLGTAKKVCSMFEEHTSALGHQGAVDAFNALGFFDGQVSLNRVPATMKRGDVAIALKVIGRLPEGKVLTLQELEEIGYEFFLIRMIANDHNELESDAAYCGAAPITGTIWKCITNV